MILRKRFHNVSLGIAFSLLAFTGVMAEAAPIPSNYTLKLFGEDTILRNPNAAASSYFELYPGSVIADPIVLDLWYSYSPTVKAELSTITISVNGVPVASRFLEAQQTATSNWQIALPANQFRTGANAVDISVVHRSIDGLCRDIDNASNWFIVKPETRVSFNLSRGAYSLSSYPRPFLDEYLASRINTALYVPANSDTTLLGALFNLASNWGGAYGVSGSPQRLEVRFGEPGQVPANEVVFGSPAKWFPNQPLSGKAPVLTLQDINGYSRLVITGDNSDVFASAVEALSRPKLVESFFGQQQVTLPTSLKAETPIANTNVNKGKYTLADLGYQDDVTVSGAFHQSMLLNVPRPADYNVGSGSYIELHFRHSKILDSKKSAVTVYVNDIPLRAAPLLAENADGGILKVPIPASELNKPSWQVRFGFYHDLGIIDCSKSYDDVAWSVVQKDTAVVLEKGRYERYPSLEDFPNNLTSQPNGAMNVTMLLPDNPSQEELTAALKLAYFVGQQNKGKISWQVQTNSSFDLKKSKGTVIALGRNNDAGQWSSLKKFLAVTPEQDNSYALAPWVEALPSTMRAFDIFQISKMNNGQLLYAFMYSDPARLDKLLQFMLINGNALKGQLTLVNAQGVHTSFISPEAAKSGDSGIIEWVASLLPSVGNTGTIYLMIFVTVLASTAAIMIFIRRRR